jgi:hypothetical protein
MATLSAGSRGGYGDPPRSVFGKVRCRTNPDLKCLTLGKLGGIMKVEGRLPQAVDQGFGAGGGKEASAIQEKRSRTKSEAKNGLS